MRDFYFILFYFYFLQPLWATILYHYIYGPDGPQQSKSIVYHAYSVVERWCQNVNDLLRGLCMCVWFGVYVCLSVRASVCVCVCVCVYVQFHVQRVCLRVCVIACACVQKSFAYMNIKTCFYLIDNVILIQFSLQTSYSHVEVEVEITQASLKNLRLASFFSGQAKYTVV